MVQLSGGTVKTRGVNGWIQDSDERDIWTSWRSAREKLKVWDSFSGTIFSFLIKSDAMLINWAQWICSFWWTSEIQWSSVEFDFINLTQLNQLNQPQTWEEQAAN